MLSVWTILTICLLFGKELRMVGEYGTCFEKNMGCTRMVGEYGTCFEKNMGCT